MLVQGLAFNSNNGQGNPYAQKYIPRDVGIGRQLDGSFTKFSRLG